MKSDIFSNAKSSVPYQVKLKSDAVKLVNNSVIPRLKSDVQKLVMVQECGAFARLSAPSAEGLTNHNNSTRSEL